MASTGDEAADDLTSVTFTNKSPGSGGKHVRSFFTKKEKGFDKSLEDTIDLRSLCVLAFLATSVFGVTFHLVTGCIV